jgi:poly(3-hydroxybutyrate) depolymerase
MLQHLLGPLRGRVKARRANLFRFNQAVLGGIASPASASLASFGYVFMPPECRQGGCRVHVAFHGCRQTTQDVGDAFVTRTGHNEWAQANSVVVVYPQASKNLLLGNPRGCWDWWGYTGRNYHTKFAPQILVVANIIRAITAGQAELLSFQE